MTNKEKQLNILISRKCRFCLYLSLGLVISLSLTKMIFSNRAATWGENLEEIKKQSQTVQKENQRLKSQIAKTTGSLVELSRLAEERGFTDKPKFQYFYPGPVVAQKMP